MTNSNTDVYLPVKASRSEFIHVRGQPLHVRKWGEEGAPMLFMLHGWMDMSATFQFLVDALQRDWLVIAPDWPGFGLSPARSVASHFPEYLLELHLLLQHYSPDAPVYLLAHSMGGNVANLYCGSYPERVTCFINIESMGTIPGLEDRAATERVRSWIETQAAPGEARIYRSRAAFARRLERANPRLGAERAAFLATHFTRPLDDGRVAVRAWERARSNAPYACSLETYIACWKSCTAEVLFFRGGESFFSARFAERGDELQRRLDCLPRVREVLVAEAGHNLQHDVPQVLAAEIEEFLPR